MDSGVETGNESNDGSVIQTENISPMVTFIGPSDMKLTINIPDLICNQGNSFLNSKLKILDSTAKTEIQMRPETNLDKDQTKSNTELVSASFFEKNLPCINEQRHSVMGTKFPDQVLDFKVVLPSNSSFSYSNPSRRKQFVSGLLWSQKHSLPETSYNSRWTCKQKSKLELTYKGMAHERRMRVAATTNNIELMKRLLDMGVSPNNCDDQGRSPLHLASCRGYTEMVNLLLTHGADPNKKDCIGNTPLHLAAVTSKISVVTLLLKAGTDVMSLDSHGHNPLQLAQTKLRVLQNYISDDSDVNQILEEVRNVIGMLMAYLQKQKDTQQQVEALSTFCSRLSLSNTSDQIQGDVRDLLDNIKALKLSN